MDFGRAFTFPFADQDWIRKIVITALISLIPFVGWLYLAGWMIEILRRVLHQTYPLLPEEIDFGKFAIDGLKTLVIEFVYSLPLIFFILPATILPILAANSGEDSIGIFVTLAICCCSGLAILYGILLAVVLPAALANFAATDDLAAGFRINEIINLVRTAPGAYLMCLAGAVVVAILSSFASVIFLIGTLLVGTYGQAVLAHLYAQAYNEAKRNRGYAQVYPA